MTLIIADRRTGVEALLGSPPVRGGRPPLGIWQRGIGFVSFRVAITLCWDGI